MGRENGGWEGRMGEGKFGIEHGIKIITNVLVALVRLFSATAQTSFTTAVQYRGREKRRISTLA